LYWYPKEHCKCGGLGFNWYFYSSQCKLEHCVKPLMLSVCHLQKKSGNFGCTVNGKAILVCQTGKFPDNWNTLRGSPKFPTRISKQKIVFHLHFSTNSRSCSNGQTISRLYVNMSELGKWYMLILNGISRSGVFAYHLHKTVDQLVCPW